MAINWNFNNSYALLPQHFYAKVEPTKVKQPKIALVNSQLALELGINLEKLSDGELAELFSGNALPATAEPLAQAYAGHQFGNFTILGDGRAHLIGEHITPSGQRIDIQLKGSGRTPFGRGGDGRAALGPMLREYIISEAMYALDIPTTRSLAVVTTGEPVHRQQMLPGAVLTRVAASHIRVGTFEYLAAQNDQNGLQRLADYAIERHYPELASASNPYLELLKTVQQQQITLIADWLRVGFIHGVMNTDNMTISGETIDYGPCAFMDEYNPKTVFSSIDHAGRYAYDQQALVARWNLARLAEALMPLFDADLDRGQTMAVEVIESFSETFQAQWLGMMQSKLGLDGEQPNDTQLIADLLDLLEKQNMDYTNTFRQLASTNFVEINSETAFKDWYQRWQQRLALNKEPLEASQKLMKAHNPAVIARNHLVEQALSLAEQDLDFSKFNELLAVIREPYAEDLPVEFTKPPLPQERVLQTFCGT